MVEFSSGGGMTRKILAKIFHMIDFLEVFAKERKEGMRPLILLDGH
jgi:hypothetical protein